MLNPSTVAFEDASGNTVAASAANPFPVSLAADTDVIGKVGIDQTTPGTTNGVAIVGVNAATALAGNGVTGTGSQRVTIASDNTAIAVLPGASAATGGIPSTGRLLSAAGTSGDATNVKASAGRVYAIQGVNVRASALYLKLYNSASAPTAGAGTPVKTLYLPASSAFAFDWPLGLTFATGIGFTIVTTGADNGSTSCTAGDILALNIDYA